MKKTKSVFSKTSQKYYSNVLFRTSLPYNDYANWGQRLSELNSFVKSFAPTKLYRFKRFSDNSLNELKNGRIYLPTPTEFNDYFDTYINFDKESLINYVADAVSPCNMARYLTAKKQSNHLLPYGLCDNIAKRCKDINIKEYSIKYYHDFMKMVKENADKIIILIKKTLVCTCFTEEIESPYMWGLYAEDNKGFAIEYDIDEHVFGIRKVFIDDDHYGFLSLMPIIYSDLNPSNDEYADQLLMGLCSPNLAEYFRTSDYLWKTKISLYKSKKWDKEKEWRIVSTFEDMYSPVNNLHATFPYPSKAVYLGISMSVENKMEILKIANDKAIKAYDIVTDLSNTFSLTYREINIYESLKQRKIIYLL